MAIYHCSVKNISRSSGKSAVASASYRSGEKLYDEEQGKTFSYVKNEVVYSEIFLCKNAPREYQDRENLWNAVEQIEKQSNARLAREWEVAIPNELTLEQSKELIKGYAQSLADEGMCVDANIHWKDGNHHAHIMGTVRAINEKGEWSAKTRKVYDLDEKGQKIPQIDKKTGLQKVDKQNRKQWKSHKEDFTDWNKQEKVEEWRERWADHCNRSLEKAQSLERVDHRSFERQEIERIPTIHEGYVARQMEQNGQTAERCEINRDIYAANTIIQSLNQRIGQLKEKAREILNGAIIKLRGNIGSFRDSRADTSRERVDETRSRARQRVNQFTYEPTGQSQLGADEIQNVTYKVGERERETAYRTQSFERREQEITRYDSSLSETDRRINKLNNGVEHAREKIAREEALNERLQRLRTARTADESARGNADGNRTVQADHSRPAGGSVAERLASLRSSRASGELQKGTGKNTVRVNEHEKEVFTRSVELGKTQQPAGTGETIGELLASARTGIDSATAKEKDSGASRADREAERERLNRERERQAKEAEQRLAKERAERKARSHDRGISR